MAEQEHEQPEKASGEPAASPNDTPKLTEPAEAAASAIPAEAIETAASVEAKSELPEVEAPSISPATPEPVAAAPEPVVEPRRDAAIPLAGESPIAPTPKAHSAFTLRPRGKRNAMLAASVALAAALGAVIGAVASGGFGKPPAHVDVASVAERQAMQKSIAQLSHEVATLKTSVETANKSSRSQIAKISERLAHERADITGSISAPRTMPAASAPKLAPPVTPQAAAPAPAPRLPQHMAALENPPAPHRSVVGNWTLQTARDGYALIESRGEIYQVVPGVPVPGLGRVSDIKREDGRWVVVTPRGIVVSQRDRRYFERF